jgi:hypothetical protein
MKALSLVTAVVCVTILPLFSQSSIGAATALGPFVRDRSPVRDIAEVYEGSVVQTGEFPSRIRLRSGARMSLGGYSLAEIHGDRLVLQRGSGELIGSGQPEYRIEAQHFRISAANGTSGEGVSARVWVGLDGIVHVTGVGGGARVTSTSSFLVASVETGSEREFGPGTPNITIMTLTGTLRQSGPAYLLTDEVTRIAVQVEGPGLAQLVGKRLEIKGTLDSAAIPINGASKVVTVATLRTLARIAPDGASAAPVATTQGGSALGVGAAFLGGAVMPAFAGTTFPGGGKGSRGPQPPPPQCTCPTPVTPSTTFVDCLFWILKHWNPDCGPLDQFTHLRPPTPPPSTRPNSAAPSEP